MAKQTHITRRTVIATGAALSVSVAVRATASEGIGPDEFDQDAITTLLVTAAEDTGASMDALYHMTKGLPLTAMRMVCNNVGKMPAPFKNCLQRPTETPSTPATVSPAMYAAIEGHREARGLADRTYDQLCLDEAGDTPPSNKQHNDVNQLVADSRKLYCDLISMKPTYPGDNSARASYMQTAFFEDALQGDEVTLFLRSLMEGK